MPRTGEVGTVTSSGSVVPDAATAGGPGAGPGPAHVAADAAADGSRAGPGGAAGGQGEDAVQAGGQEGDAAGDTGPAPLLESRSVSIHFGGIHALVDVSVSVQAGEIVGLVGPNGAGKTTLFNCVCGTYRPSSGSVRFDGTVIDGLPAYRRARLGIGRTFQRIEVFPEMTVRDHMLVAIRAHAGTGRLWKDLLNLGAPKPAELEAADKVLELVGLTDLADTPVAALSLGHCRLVELGRALATEPRLLLADEPSSGLDTNETALLADLLRRVRAERGTAILLVEHDLEMVARLVDRAVVLDFGHVIAAGPLEQVIADPQVRLAYLGKTA